MGGSSWIVHEGFLQWKQENEQGKPQLVDRYFVLRLSRKLEVFDRPEEDSRTKITSANVLGFCAWDGDGLLKVDAYGLELKVEKHKHKRMHLAAFNRLDLDKWCKGLLAVVDPSSAVGEEVRKQRRKAKKEQKRAIQEREDKIRRWKALQEKIAQEEHDRALAREEQINNMTPLERIDDLGSLDDDTLKILERRKNRLHRQHAPTTGRMNKSAYRRRLEAGAGGNISNVQPLQTKVVEPKAKVKVELPPPGKFIEAAPSKHRSQSVSSAPSSPGNRSDSSNASMDSKIPPPPPRSSDMSSRSSFVPPPPPEPSHSRASSISRDSLFDSDDDDLAKSTTSIRSASKGRSQSSFSARNGDTNHRPSLDSRSSSSRSKKKKDKPDASNAFAMSLAAIRQHRVDSMDLNSNFHETSPKKRKERQNLFDDSDSDSDDASLFQLETKHPEKSHPSATTPTSPSNSKPPTHNAGSQDIHVSCVNYFVGKEMEKKKEKEVDVYNLVFRLESGEEHQVAYSYGDMEAIHGRLLAASKSSKMPKLPSKHWHRNMIKEENMAKRAKELVDYLEQLVQVPGMVMNDQFQFEFRLNETFRSALTGSSKSTPLPKSEKTKKNLFDDSDSESDDSSLQSVPMSKPKRETSPTSVKSDEREEKTSSPKKDSPKEQMKPPNPMAGRGDLMAAIRQGAQLKHTEKKEEKEEKTAPEAPPMTINDAITNAISNRRVQVEYEESSKGDSDSDDDWED